MWTQTTSYGDIEIIWEIEETEKTKTYVIDINE
jgi:hypothetical protein